MCTGDYAAKMERCVESARRAGVFREFHVLADRQVEGCQCYDAMQCDKSDGMFKLHYLKVGMSRLPFEFFIWVDSDTTFLRNPVNILELLRHSPIHVPLDFNLAKLSEDVAWRGCSSEKLRGLFRDQGVVNDAFLSQSAFWIVAREAIDLVYDLAVRFWHASRQFNLNADANAALGYAMQMLCGNPSAHALDSYGTVWANDYAGACRTGHVDECFSWRWQHPLGGPQMDVSPAVVHAPHARDWRAPKEAQEAAT